jgi:hypothetical protein
MTISTVELSQQHSYQQTSNQRRKVSLIASANGAQNETVIEPPASLLSGNLITAPLIETTYPEEDLTYGRPKELRLQLMVLVLENFLGRSLDISDFSFAKAARYAQDDNSNLNAVTSPTNLEQISIDDQSFQRGDYLSVEQWQSHEQHLNYQVKGVLNINDQVLSLNYSFSLSNTHESYSKVEMSAAALKDPIILQFGSQGLGRIEGHKSFHINQDNTVDALPLFSGDVGYLVYDKSQNNQADDGSELFGPQTGQGFLELTALDSNKNGFIDAEDEQFEQLYLWQPSEDNSQAEQWLSLKEAKIQAISLSTSTTPFDFYDQQGKIEAQLRQSSFSISDNGIGRGVHQVDVRI